MAKVKITLKRSLIGQGHKSRETIKSLGLKKINSSVERELDNSLEAVSYTHLTLPTICSV